jgi:hypothetical protein
LGDKREIGRCQSFLQGSDLNVGIDGIERRAGGVDLHCADRVAAVQDLALQVGEVDLVGVGERQAPDAGGGQVEGRGAAEAARADNQNVRRAQPLLPLDPDLGEQDMAAIP